MDWRRMSILRRTDTPPLNLPEYPQSEIQQPRISWTKNSFTVEKFELFREPSGSGKDDLVSLLLELREEETSNHYGERSTLFLTLGATSRDLPTLTQILLGRKVELTQAVNEDLSSRKELAEENFRLRKLLEESEGKVKYLNDSLHNYIQESRSV
jgi:hypothetical protein